jgi:hypothetical protein
MCGSRRRYQQEIEGLNQLAGATLTIGDGASIGPVMMTISQDRLFRRRHAKASARA